MQKDNLFQTVNAEEKDAEAPFGLVGGSDHALKRVAINESVRDLN
jgi:hypothetical protein